MKKVILSTIISLIAFQILPVLAQNSTSSHVKKDKKGEVNLVCMQNAVVKRDNAVISAIDIYAGAARKSIETRRDALKTAWTIADKHERKEALRTAWENDKNTRNTARRAFKKSKNGAWETFRTERKVCKDKGDSDGDRGSSHDDL
ncbi:MAG: hypothetical protein AABX29_00190 [Nanoarchaeota archaeon]